MSGEAIVQEQDRDTGPGQTAAIGPDRPVEATSSTGTRIHDRHQLWLLAIGAIHGYLIWLGDILASYATLGLILWLFRRRRPHTLILTGLCFMVVGSLMMAGAGLFSATLVAQTEEAKRLEAAGLQAT